MSFAEVVHITSALFAGISGIWLKLSSLVVKIMIHSQRMTNFVGNCLKCKKNVGKEICLPILEYEKEPIFSVFEIDISVEKDN